MNQNSVQSEERMLKELVWRKNSHLLLLPFLQFVVATTKFRTEFICYLGIMTLEGGRSYADRFTFPIFYCCCFCCRYSLIDESVSSRANPFAYKLNLLITKKPCWCRWVDQLLRYTSWSKASFDYDTPLVEAPDSTKSATVRSLTFAAVDQNYTHSLTIEHLLSLTHRRSHCARLRLTNLGNFETLHHKMYTG